MTQETRLIGDCRKAFEEWCAPRCFLMGQYEGGIYIAELTQLAWSAWQAAWDIQVKKLEACVQEMTGGCPT